VVNPIDDAGTVIVIEFTALDALTPEIGTLRDPPFPEQPNPPSAPGDPAAARTYSMPVNGAEEHPVPCTLSRSIEITKVSSPARPIGRLPRFSVNATSPAPA